MTDSQLGLAGVNSAGQRNYNGINRHDDMGKLGSQWLREEKKKKKFSPSRQQFERWIIKSTVFSAELNARS